MNLPYQVSFAGKVVVITGAGGVLCGDMARAFAQAGAKVAALATGEVYTAKEALAHGLADEIGYFDDALAHARGLAQAPKAQVFQYEEAVSFDSMMDALSGKSGLRQLLGAAVGPRLLAE